MLHPPNQTQSTFPMQKSLLDLLSCMYHFHILPAHKLVSSNRRFPPYREFWLNMSCVCTWKKYTKILILMEFS